MFAISLNLGPIVYIVQTIGGILLDLAAPLITLSYLASALMWVFAGPSEKLVKMARQQFIATTVTLLIIVGYVVFRSIAMQFALGGFG